MENRDKLKRRLERLQEMEKELTLEHNGNELNYTYWGGFKLGHLRGRISVLEEILYENEI